MASRDQRVDWMRCRKSSWLAPLQERVNTLPKQIYQNAALSAAYTALASLPMIAQLSVSYLRGPHHFNKRVDRSATRFPDSVEGLHHIYVEANGIKLHIVTNSQRPTGSQPLLLFLHGFPEFWYSWRHQLQAFKSKYHVAAIDMRGYGDSDKPQDVGSFTMDKLANDVKGVVDALGHQSCVLVGHDWGGVVAQAAALKHPGIVDKLVLMGTLHLRLLRENLDWEQLLRSSYIWAFQLPRLGELVMTHSDCDTLDSALTNPRQGGMVRPPVAASPLLAAVLGRELMPVEDVNFYKQQMQKQGAATAEINYYRALLKYPEASRMFDSGKVRAPTLFIHGEADMFLGNQLLQGLPDVFEDVKLVRLPKCSHWVQQHRPDEVNQLMQSFLSGRRLPVLEANTPPAPPSSSAKLADYSKLK